MKSVKVVFLIIVVSALLGLTYGMDKAELSQPQPSNVEAVSLATATEPPFLDLISTYSISANSGAGPMAGSILVIPTVDADEPATTAFVTAATKDLNIMCRVFDKEVRLGTTGSGLEHILFDTRYGRNLGFHLGPSGRNASCIYLQGLAAIFLMDVDFPLAPGPEEADVEPKLDEPADMVWHQAQQELYGPKNPSKKQKDSVKKYDPKQVEDFETNLLKTLKHAANIRCLGQDEWVIAVVWGPGSTSSSPRTLVVRTKQADIVGLSEGTLTLDKFRDGAQIFTMPAGTRPQVHR